MTDEVPPLQEPLAPDEGIEDLAPQEEDLENVSGGSLGAPIEFVGRPTSGQGE